MDSMGFKEEIISEDRILFSLLEGESNIVIEPASLLLEDVNDPPISRRIVLGGFQS